MQIAFFFLNNGETRIWDVFFIPTLECGALRHHRHTTRYKAQGREAQTPFSVLLAADSLSKRQQVANVKRCPAAADLHQR